MNALAILYVEQHMEEIRRDSASRHQHRKVLSVKEQIAAAAAAFKGAFTWHDGLQGSFLPKLQAYPYQS